MLTFTHADMLWPKCLGALSSEPILEQIFANTNVEVLRAELCECAKTQRLVGVQPFDESARRYIYLSAEVNPFSSHPFSSLSRGLGGPLATSY